jgi:hypothetical protein
MHVPDERLGTRIARLDLVREWRGISTRARISTHNPTAHKLGTHMTDPPSNLTSGVMGAPSAPRTLVMFSVASA